MNRTLVKLHTDGSGYWSQHSRTVRITGFRYVPAINWVGDRLYGSLLVRFNTHDWYCRQHGLIYSDRLFLKELKEFLREKGCPAKALATLDYSEQGRQGNEFVDLDASEAFEEWVAFNQDLVPVESDIAIEKLWYDPVKDFGGWSERHTIR